MTSIRQQIRAELLARMVDLPNAASKPLDNLEEVVDETKLPVARIALGIEEIVDSTNDGAQYRSLPISIVLSARRLAGKSAIEVAEEMAVEVEARMAPPWNGLEFALESTEPQEEKRAGAEPFSGLRLAYSTRYTTRIGKPDALFSY